MDCHHQHHQLDESMFENKSIHQFDSKKLDLTYNVHVQNETQPNTPRCFIVTVHDIGCDYVDIADFISHPSMATLRDRVIWLHVNLPGQQDNAPDLEIQKYPSLCELGEELSIVLEHFKIHQAVLFGEGAGANICMRFAMKHASQCLGIILINPSGSTAGFLETMKDKIFNLSLMKHGGQNREENYLIYHRFGQSHADHDLSKPNVKDFHVRFYQKRNQKNALLYIESYLNRANVLDHVASLQADVLTVFGRRSVCAHETHKFYEALCVSRKNESGHMANCSLLEVEEAVDIMGEMPERLATSTRFFLQGIGLVAGIPLSKSLPGMGKRLSKDISMEAADTPRKLSLVEKAHDNI